MIDVKWTRASKITGVILVSKWTTEELQIALNSFMAAASNVTEDISSRQTKRNNNNLRMGVIEKSADDIVSVNNSNFMSRSRAR